MTATATNISTQTDFEIVKDNLLTVGQQPVKVERGSDGHPEQHQVATTRPRAERLEASSGKGSTPSLVSFSDDGKDEDEDVGRQRPERFQRQVPGAFTVSGNSVNSVLVVGNDIYLTLARNWDLSEQPYNHASPADSIKDKAGNAYGGSGFRKASRRPWAEPEPFQERRPEQGEGDRHDQHRRAAKLPA